MRICDPVDVLESGGGRVMMGAFLRGLRWDIKAKLKVLGPTTLEEAMIWADRIDKKNSCSWLGRRQMVVHNYSNTLQKNQIPAKIHNSAPVPNFPNSNSRVSNSQFTNPSFANSNSRPAPPQPIPARNRFPPSQTGSTRTGSKELRLIDQEYSEKQAKGLCFHCDQKWSLNHACSKKAISVLIGVEENEESVGEELHVEEILEEEESEAINISLNLVVGITNPKTISSRKSWRT